MADPALLSFSWCPGHGVSRNIAPTSAFAFIPGQSPANWVRDPSPLSSGIHSGPFYQPRPRPPSVSNWCACFPQHCCPMYKWGTMNSQATAKIINCVTSCLGTWLWTPPQHHFLLSLRFQLGLRYKWFQIATHRQHGKPESNTAILGLL